MAPCSTPTRPSVMVAAWRPVATPSPAASTPISRTEVSCTKGWNSPMALEPPPTQAISTSGRRPKASCALALGLLADHGMEIPHQHRVGVRAGHRAEDVVGGLHVGDPVADRLAGGVLEGGGAGGHRLHRGPQQPHAEHIQGLTAHVLGAHVDHALQTEAGTDGGGGHPVLAGAGLGDDPLLAHPQRQQGLAQGVVDLVGAGVVEVLALQPEARSAFGAARSAR